LSHSTHHWVIKTSGSPSGAFLTPETSPEDVREAKTLWSCLPEALPDMFN